MISKVEPCKVGNDNYARLANYIADTGHDGEKSLLHWCVGCADDDYLFSIQEVKDTQAINERTTKNKTYHLIVSFRPEDEPKLTPETFKAIELYFAKALGFEEHQRHCGVHKNTDNLHMHMAYNMIHPEKFTRHEPYRDFFKRDQVCREVELEFGLTVDNGRGQKQTMLEVGAAKMEAHTGHQSFESYAKSHKEQIMQSVATATSWEDVHKALSAYGMEILPHGNGLVIRDRSNPKKAKYAMKASVLDRSFSKKKLEERFGAYAKAQEKYQAERVYDTYTPREYSSENKASYADYKKQMLERKEALDSIQKDYEDKRKSLDEKWEVNREKIRNSGLEARAMRRLFRLAKKKEFQERYELKGEVFMQRASVKEKFPHTSWAKYKENVNGNTIAYER